MSERNDGENRSEPDDEEDRTEAGNAELGGALIPDINPNQLPSGSSGLSLRWSVTVEDIPEDDEDPDPEGNRLVDLENGVNWTQEMDNEDLTLDFDATFNLDRGLSVNDLLDEQLEHELADVGQYLTKEELATMRHFALKVETHMTDETFAKLPFAC
ncbi:hypothetical protein C8R41DRAFT_921184 [Lentinula lateritia]|uniref:Uncharacterized protein n=1 Tax=Lentinula lateritia TaxID=40482 RepID=A0ABQ8VGY1_9AGAR|nr:hypothetical protein C8R41DRAFT_921184 [Lentinula lateritia]